MKVIFFISILLSSLYYASPNRYGLDGLGLRLLLDLRDLTNDRQLQSEEESIETGEESQLEGELHLAEEETALLDMHLIGEDGKNTMFFQVFFENGAVSGESGGTIAAVFDDGSSVVIEGDSGGDTEGGSSSSSPVNGIDNFDDLAASANSWSFELGPSANGLYYATDLPANTRLDGGFFYIDALKESFEGSEYTSASISSEGKVELQYGLFVIRAKFSYTKGVYPLFMMFNQDRSCGVIVMGGGISPNTIFSQVSVLTSSSTPAGYTLPSGTTEDFHDYGVLWYPNGMDFYVDEALYASVNATNFGDVWPFDTFGMFLNLQLAVGGPLGNPDDSSVFPQEFAIDAVGIFQGT